METEKYSISSNWAIIDEILLNTESETRLRAGIKQRYEDQRLELMGTVFKFCLLHRLRKPGIIFVLVGWFLIYLILSFSKTGIDHSVSASCSIVSTSHCRVSIHQLNTVVPTHTYTYCKWNYKENITLTSLNFSLPLISETDCWDICTILKTKIVSLEFYTWL